ncbi:MAG: tetratricopeptide repeat protein [Flavipsychrobacter sp.]|nr:tetratricopeptide repeat protein [Flavipsychrobacter sp.]
MAKLTKCGGLSKNVICGQIIPLFATGSFYLFGMCCIYGETIFILTFANHYPTTMPSPNLKACLCFIIFLCSASPAPAQKLEGTLLVDSLIKALPANKSTRRVDILNTLVPEQRRTSPDSALRFAREALAIARELRYSVGIGDSYLSIANAQESLSDYAAAIENCRTAIETYRKLDTISIAGNSKKETKIARVNNTIGVIYGGLGKIDSAFHYFRTAVETARSGRDTAVMAIGYNNLGAGYFMIGEVDTAMRYYQLSLVLRKAIRNQQGISESYQNISRLLSNQGKQDEALNYLVQAMAIKEQLGDKKGLADLNANRGKIYIDKGDFTKGLESHERALALRKEMNDRRGIAASLADIGSIHRSLGGYTRALTYFLEAKKINEEIGNQIGLMNSFTSIGSVFLSLHELDNAISNYQAAREIALRNKDQKILANIHINLGIVKSELGMADSALAEFQMAIELSERKGYPGLQATAEANIGQLYTVTGKYDLALEHFNKGLIISEQIESPVRLAEGYMAIADVYRRMKRLPSARQYIRRAEEYAKDIPSLELHKSLYWSMSLIDSASGDYQSALTHYMTHIEFRDSIFNRDNNRNIIQLQVQYEADRKQDSLKQVHNAAIATQKQKAAASLRFWLTIAAATLVLSLVVFYFYRRREQDKLKAQVTQARREALKAQLDSHFISDTLTAINEFVENNEYRSASSYLLKFSRLVNSVLKSSFQASVTLEEELDFVDTYFNLASLRYRPGHIRYKATVLPGLDPAEAVVPSMVLQVLVENAIKHAFTPKQGGDILVQIERVGDTVRCTVEDNGRGRHDARLQPERNRPSMGTSLSERLVDTWNKGKGAGTFQTIDLKDSDGLPGGTKVVFSFPFITY